MLINYNKRKDKYYAMLFDTYANAEKVLKLPCENIEINVALVSSKTIRKMNAKWRGIDKVTDVLSFPNLAPTAEGNIICSYLDTIHYGSEVNPATGNIMLGDIYICVRKVKQQAKEYGHSLAREFSYLGLHGLLHVLGYDHIDESDKKVMRAKEEEILKEVL